MALGQASHGHCSCPLWLVRNSADISVLHGNMVDDTNQHYKFLLQRQRITRPDVAQSICPPWLVGVLWACLQQQGSLLATWYMHTIIVSGIRKIPLAPSLASRKPCNTHGIAIVIGSGMARSMHAGGGGACHQFPAIGIRKNIYQQHLKIRLPSKINSLCHRCRSISTVKAGMVLVQRLGLPSSQYLHDCSLEMNQQEPMSSPQLMASWVAIDQIIKSLF